MQTFFLGSIGMTNGVRVLGPVVSPKRGTYTCTWIA